MLESSWRELRANWALVAGFAVLGVVIWQTTAVWGQNRAILATIERGRATVVKAGDQIDAVVGTTLKAVRARYQITGHSSGSLLIALSTDCGFCDKNIDAWHRLSGQARETGLQVAWVSRDTLERVRSDTDLDDGLIADPNHTTYVQLKLSTVPQTVIVGKDGIVTDVHVGVLDASGELRMANALKAIALR